jgi:hypothetical protein
VSDKGRRRLDSVDASQLVSPFAGDGSSRTRPHSGEFAGDPLQSNTPVYENRNIGMLLGDVIELEHQWV